MRKMKCNTVFISSTCYHFRILFLHFKFLSNHYFDGFGCERSLFSHFIFHVLSNCTLFFISNGNVLAKLNEILAKIYIYIPDCKIIELKYERNNEEDSGLKH